jgi:hypothetical protein
MLIRIIKALPAPMMDGHDVRAFRLGQVYQVESRVGRYLIAADYAVAVKETASENSKSQTRE